MATATDVDGQRFGWREAGTGATSVVLLHGLGGSRISWEPQLHGLSSSHRVVAWDMPRYGASAPLEGEVTFRALADAVIDLLDTAGIGQAHLVGISFGGMIAQYVAAWHPNRVLSLALLATSPAFGLDGTKPDEWRAARLAPLDAGHEPSDLAERLLTSLAGPHISADALDGQVQAMCRVSGEALRLSIDCLVTHDSRELLPTITAPTLCMVGELDDETPLTYSFGLADLIPDARLTVIEGAGHLLNVEAPDIVNQLLAEHAVRP